MVRASLYNSAETLFQAIEPGACCTPCRSAFAELGIHSTVEHLDHRALARVGEVEANDLRRRAVRRVVDMATLLMAVDSSSETQLRPKRFLRIAAILAPRRYV